MKLKLSFQSWILAGCLLVSISTLLAVGVVLERSLDIKLVEQVRLSLVQQLILLKEVIGDRWRPGTGADQTQALAKELGEKLGLRITLVSPQGVVWGDSHLDQAGVIALGSHLERPEVAQALTGGQGQSQRFSGTLGLNQLYVAELLGTTADPGLVIRLSLPLAGVAKTVAATRRALMGAVVLGLVLSVVVAYFTARRITRPIKDLTSTAQVMASGDLSPRVRRYPPHEIGELGRVFDAMADNLQRQVAALTRANDRQEAILRGMAEGVMLTDREGRILLANRALVKLLNLGMSPVGRTHAEVMRNPDLQEAMRRVLGGEAHISKEISTLGPAPRYLEAHVVRVAGQTPGAGAVAVFHDVTERHRVEKMRRDFVANVSHELRTPLTAIKGAAETLLQGALESPEDARRFADMIDRQAGRLGHLVADLLDLASIESGEAAPHLEEVRLDKLAESLLEEMADRAAHKGLVLVNKMSERPLSVQADRQLLEQALLNLLDNALKYTDPGGQVSLGVQDDAQEVAILVGDTGLGIAQPDQARLFERFYRVDKDRSREMGGTGLGLAIVKHIAQAHGGRVEVESRLGAGSTFRLVLPRQAG
ncbi:MAG: HAMP domain-containing protein [Desulfarculus sp.]|nr:HAMP domain-containing protein [Desulfarculus sp.]